MNLAIQSLPNAKPVSYPPTIVIDEENDEENDDFLRKSDAQRANQSISQSQTTTALGVADDTLFSGSSLEKDEENEEEFVVQKVASNPELETSLEKSLPSTVEFIEVKEAEDAEVEAVQEVINAVVESVEEPVEQLEEAVSEEKVEEVEMEDDVEEISKEEFEPLKSSKLVNDLFEKYQKDTKPEEDVKKPEPPKSYLGSMWSYLGWKSK
jgi:hypothetical protein